MQLFHPTAAESSVRAVSLTEKRSSMAARTTRERRSWLRTRRAYRSLPQALSGRKAFLMTKKVVRLILSCSLVAVRILSCLRNLDSNHLTIPQFNIFFFNRGYVIFLELLRTLGYASG